LNPGKTPVYDVHYTMMKPLSSRPSLTEIMTNHKNQLYGFESVVLGSPKGGLMTPTSFEVPPGEYAVRLWMRNGEIDERIRMEQGIRAVVVKRGGKTLESNNPQNLSALF
jgi:hypothetical protein